MNLRLRDLTLALLLTLLAAFPALVFAQCREETNPLIWSDGPQRCWLPGPFPALEEGAVKLWFFDSGRGDAGSGYLLEKCTAGKRLTVTSRCIRWCDAAVTIVRGQCRYSYGDLTRGKAPRLLEGEGVQVGKGRCATQLVCTGGEYRLLPLR